MKIKIIKEINDAKVGSLIECDDETGAQLIADGYAMEVTEEVLAEEKRLAIKNIVISKSVKNVKKEKVMENDMIKRCQDDPLVVGKMFQHICGKTITGNSEASAADGAALVHTGLAALQPIVMLGSRVMAKTTNIPISANANAMKVPFSISDTWTKASAEVISNANEGVAYTATKGQLDAATLTLTKAGATVAITDELLEDAAGVQAWIQAELAGKLANVLDYEILKGGGAGMTAINGATGYTLTSALSATPTVAEYIKLVNMIHPNLSDGAEWYMSLTDWNLAIATFMVAANLDKQYIDFANKVLFGKKVNVMPFLASGDVLLVNLSKYATVATPIRITQSSDVRFLEGEVVIKISTRCAGAPIYKAHSTGDSISVSFASEKS